MRSSNTQFNFSFPGQAKNAPKFFITKLQAHIKSVLKKTNDPNLKKLKDDEVILQFLAIQRQDMSKKKLDYFLPTRQISLFAREFFGNLKWMQEMLRGNKATTIDFYFQQSMEYCQFSLQQSDEHAQQSDENVQNIDQIL